MKHKPSNNGDKSFLEINQYELEREWVEQPRLYEQWATKAAKARLRLDEAKGELELIEAELDKTIRTEPGKFGVDKITEGAVQKTVVLQDEYQEAAAAVNQAAYELGVIQAAVTALDHRKKALEKLVELWMASYYSEPKARGEAKNRMEDAGKRAVRGKAVRRAD